MKTDIQLFISHSSKDAEIAEILIELVKNAMPLRPEEIRCTSVEGHRLPGGANFDEVIRAEVMEAEAFIGLISPNTMKSAYAVFELGARWASKKHFMPILAPDVDASSLEKPLNNLHALQSGNCSEMHQMVEEIAKHLGLLLAAPSAYDKYVKRLGNQHNSKPSLSAAASLVLSENKNCNTGHKLERTQLAPPLVGAAVAVSTHRIQPFVEQLQQFGSESGKLRLISEYLRNRPTLHFSFAEILPLVSLFSSESARLKVLEYMVNRATNPSDQQTHQLMSMFSSESSKLSAYQLVKRSCC